MSLRDRVLQTAPGATVLAHAPGRVNLIGEHTDYNGFPVLPLAIDRRIWVASSPLAGRLLRVRSVDPVRYPAEEIPLDAVASRPRRGSWTDYVVAAARALPPAAGLELTVGGDIPAEAGLSSSSALVVAAMLALAPPGDREALAERARAAERYVGTLSGGMDQAISLLAREGHALRIGFRPLRATPVRVPESLGVVVAHSGILAAKSGAAREAYNQRVRECGAAAERLGAPAGGVLADVARDDRRPERIDDPLLARRAGFVFAEADRVDRVVAALAAGDLAAVGRLLDASHRGLRDDYEVSHPAVDALVERSRGLGALGARVVGAGFGGCVVAVCARENAPALASDLGPDAWVFEAGGPAGRERL